MKYQHMNVHWYQCNEVKETTLKKVLNMDEFQHMGSIRCIHIMAIVMTSLKNNYFYLVLEFPQC